MDNCSQKEHVMRLRMDDVKAFNSLYQEYHHVLYSNILKLCKDVNGTQDVLQDVFITLWEKRFTLDPNQPVSNWLFTVSYNKSINYLKKKLKSSVELKDLDGGICDGYDKEINIQEIQLHLIEKAVQQLSPQKKKVFDLCKLQGKSYEETAKELNISKHTVKEYLSDAVINIKAYIKDHPLSVTDVFCATLLSVIHY